MECTASVRCSYLFIWRWGWPITTFLNDWNILPFDLYLCKQCCFCFLFFILFNLQMEPQFTQNLPTSSAYNLVCLLSDSFSSNVCYVNSKSKYIFSWKKKNTTEPHTHIHYKLNCRQSKWNNTDIQKMTISKSQFKWSCVFICYTTYKSFCRPPTQTLLLFTQNSYKKRWKISLDFN